MGHTNQNIIGDQMTYLVICSHKLGSYVRERNVSEMDRKATIADIASGEIEHVVQVLEFNPVEHVCSDVTGDVLREAALSILDGAHYDGLSDWQKEFVDANAAGALIAHRRECRSEDAHRRSLMGAL